MLPPGYLSTSGNQIVDSAGNPVRIASIGWDGTDSLTFAPYGLWQSSLQQNIEAIVADGFNTIRIPWTDLLLNASPEATASYYAINPALNPELVGLTSMQVLDVMVAEAGAAGLKVILDHHDDDGGPGGWGGQQANGLWIDEGPGTDGTDGSGTTGTVDAATFLADSVAIAQNFAGNSTVIGFDLDNEPTSAGDINWGQGGPTDIQAMYTEVGDAIQAVDPGALIIAEGPEEWSGPAPGMPAGFAEGDLSGVATDPVTLTIPDKVVYSVHEYPPDLSGNGSYDAATEIAEMNAGWGYLETDDIAPVWVGEMGSNMTSTQDATWIQTLLDYMNGDDGAEGGPTFTGNEEPVSGSWWQWGSAPGQDPEGVETAWGSGEYWPAQQVATDQLLYTPTDLVIISGSTDIVSAGTSVSFTVVSGGATELVASGGTASATVVSSGGTEIVSSGGMVLGTTVSAGGTEVISAGAVASGTMVSSGGTETLVTGGIATGIVVNSGGVLVLDETTIANGSVFTASDGPASINDNGVQVLIGGTIEAQGALVLAAGEVAASAGGILSGTVLGSGALATIGSGGTADDTVVTDGGFAIVQSGGTALDTSVQSGGALLVLPGAQVESTNAIGGSVISTGALVVSGDPTLTAAGGALSGAVIGSGEEAIVLSSGSIAEAYVTDGGSMTVYRGGSALHSIVDSGGFIYLSSGGMASATNVRNGGTEVVSSAGSAVATSLGTGGAIDVSYLTYTTGGSAVLDPTTDLLRVTEGAQSYTQQLSGDYTGEFFHANPDTDGGTVVTDDGMACYCRGTRILTPAGEVAVEALQIGDRVVTRSGEARPIRWIGQRSYAGRFAADNRDVLPVKIRADALADRVPARDLLVSPAHAMFIDAMLIPAGALINGMSIVQLEAVDKVDYFHVELDSHDVILADGAPSETFVDDGSRFVFQNAAAYRTLHPGTTPGPAQYCAPRVEDGEALETVRRRLAARLFAAAAAPCGRLQSYLDHVDRDVIRGWARDEAVPDAAVRLQIIDNGVTLCEVVADRYRDDLRAAGFGGGYHSFEMVVPGGLSPSVRHVIEVRRAADGQLIDNSPWVLEPAHDAAADPPPCISVPGAPAAACLGYVDTVARDRIIGWAMDDSAPDTPVALVIADNGAPIGRVLANQYRRDLDQAGIGAGRHAFEIRIDGGLSPAVRHVIRVTRERDGAELQGSPAVIDPVGSFDAALEKAIARAVDGLTGAEDQDRALAFLVAQTDRVLQQRAESQAGRTDRLTYQQFRRRWGPATDSRADVAEPAPRALVIDERMPAEDRDAGSHAILSHMRALRALGYSVSFIAASEMAQPGAHLAAAGITCCAAPFYASAEDVLRRQTGCFDVVYLHRAEIAARYLALVRRYVPRARILYSVADLGHVRLARQAAVEGRPELLAQSRRMRLIECTAAWSADAVITHSSVEADLLRQAVPEANVHVVPWDVAPQPTAVPAGRRRGIAFIGSFDHPPNADAAHWLSHEVMPLVRQVDPAIACLLVGSAMPRAWHHLAAPGILPLGQVDDIREVFDRVRLTVAPLRFGAGIKGKVLQSFAAGVPCLMSEAAAEGLPLSPKLRALVARDAPEMAALICRLHADADACDDASKAGLSFIRRRFGLPSISAALHAAIGRGAATTLAA